MMLFYRVAALLMIMSLSESAVAQQNVSFSQVLEQPFNEPGQVIPYGPDANQTLSIWQASPARAEVVLIHGGCWLSDYDIQHTYAMSSALQQANYTVYSFEYRRTGKTGGGWPVTYQDIQQGFDKVLSLRDKTLPLTLSGHSAGGHLALLLGSEPYFQDHIDAVIGLAAITNIARYATGDNSCERVTADFMGGTPDQLARQYDAANPATKTPHPRTLLLQGTADTIVAPDYAREIPQATVTQVAGAGHFDWVHPQTAAFDIFLEALQQVPHD